MAEPTKQDDDRSSAPSPSIVLMMLGTVADTSWRLFIPTIGGTVLGLWADNSWGTKPLFTIIGVVGGTILAFSLVYLQLKKVTKK